MLATAVIVISLVVQGLTLEPLVRVAGIARPDGGRHEETVARLRLAEAALARLDELADGDGAADDAIDRARAGCRPGSGAPAPGSTAPGAEPDGLTDRDLRRALNAAEHAELARLYDNGTISQTTRQRLQRDLDLEAARLGDDLAIAEQVRIIVSDADREVAQPADLDFTHAEAESVLQAVAGHPSR